MDPQKQQKKRVNKNKPDHDPIIQKRVKPNKSKKSHKPEAEAIDTEPVHEEEEEKLNFEKFTDLFKEGGTSKLAAKQLAKQNRAQNKVVVKDYNVAQYPRLNIAEAEQDPLTSHFGLSISEMVKSKVDLLNEKVPENAADKYNMPKDFSYAFEEDDEDLDVINVAQGVVTNNVKIKEYQVKPTLKGAGKLYQDKGGEVWNTDNRVESSTNGKQGFISQPVIHPSLELNVAVEDSDENPHLKTVLPIMESYLDLVYTDANEDNCPKRYKFRRLWIIHVLNHIRKAQEIEKINAQTRKDGEEQGLDEEEVANNLQKYKGYTRARVLVLVPYKGDAFEIISFIKEMYTGKGFTKMNMKTEKFLEEYGSDEDILNDDFKIGLAFGNDKLVLYSPFSSSDIIITSPLGLRRIVGAQGDKEREYSFLSSVEIFVMERAHVISMQNWQHMDEIMPMLNGMPRHKDMTSDINEIREYYFDNMSKFFRQNIVYTEFRFPELNSLASRYFHNFQGLINNRCTYDRLISETEVEVNQEFMKFDCDSFQKEADYRFEYFKTKVWEKVRFNDELDRIVLFVSSYFDFLRLRSYFKKINANVTYASEYTPRDKAQSRIAHFLNKKFKFLLVTERAYFFKVVRLRNFSNIVFYSLPRNATIYRELILSMDKIKEAAGLSREKARKLTLRVVVRSMFNKFDALTIERIVGTEKCKEYIAEYNKGTTFIL